MTKKDQWCLFALCLPVFMLGIDVMSVGVIVAPVIREFPGSPGLPQWVISAYAIGAASSMLLSGRLADRFGRCVMLGLGVLLFGLASGVAAWALNIESLIVARALQGVGGALFLVSAIAMVNDVFKSEHRARVMGLIVMTTGFGTALGPLVGGFFVNHFGWRSLFLINLPVCVLALCCILMFLRGIQQPKSQEPLDYLGLILGALALVSLSVGLSMNKWLSWEWIIGFILVAVLLGLVFWWHEKRCRFALLPMEKLYERHFVLAAWCGFIAYFVIFSWLFLFSVFLPQVFGYSPLETGLALIPFSVAFAYTAANIAKAIERYGHAVVLVSALGLAAAGTLLFAICNPLLPYWAFAIGFVFLGIGCAAINAAAMAFGMESVAPGIAGRSSAVLMTFRFLGGAMGIAFVSSIAQRISSTVFSSWAIQYHLPSSKHFNLLLEKVLSGLLPLSDLSEHFTSHTALLTIFAAKTALSEAVVVMSILLSLLLLGFLAVFVYQYWHRYHRHWAHENRQVYLAFKSRQFGLLYICCGVFFIGNFELSAIGYSLPTLQSSSLVSMPYVWSLLTAYTVGLATTLLLGGYLVDRYGDKCILLWSVGIFTAAAVIDAWAPDQSYTFYLVVAQGIGIGLSWPAVQTIVMQRFLGHQQRFAMGMLFGFGAALGMCAGPILAGYFAERLSWEFLMWVLAVFALVLWVGIWGMMKYNLAKVPRPINWVQVGLLIVASGALSYGLTQAQKVGFANLSFDLWMLFGLALVLVVAIHRIATNYHDVLTEVFTCRGYISGVGCHLVALYGYIMVFFMLSLYFEHERYLPANQSGVMLLPLIAGVIIVAPLVGILKRGSIARWLLIGMFCFMLGLFWLIVPKPGEFNWWHIYVPLAVMGIGLGMIFPTSNLMALRAIKPQHIGVASALLYFLSILALSLGISISGVIARWGAKTMMGQSLIEMGWRFSPAQQHALGEAIQNMQLTRYILQNFNTQEAERLIDQVDVVYLHSFHLAGYVALLFCFIALVVLVISQLLSARESA